MENNKLVVISSGLILVFLAGLVLRLAKPVFFPFFLAIFFYFILSPILDFLMRLKIPKLAAVFLIIISSFVILYLLGILFYTSGKGLAEAFPDYARRLTGIVSSLTGKLGLSNANWEPWLWSKSLDGTRVASFFVQSLNQVFSFFSTFILIFVFLIFMLAGRGKLKTKVERSFSRQRASKINEVLDNIDRDVQKYLSIKTGISFLSGFLTMLVLLIFGVDFAVIFGFLTFVLNFIPSLGSITAVALTCIIAAFQFGSIFPAVWILLILIALDTVVSNFVEPKLVGRGLGLSPLVIIFSLFFWGWLWGIPGMILAVPLMAVVRIVCSNVPSLKPVAEIMSA
ncbi:MAG: AI-2E family transporter [Acidobacteriota bacterium]